MSDTDLPEPQVQKKRRNRIGWVWLMPLVAVAISAYVVWQNWQNQGPLITVIFPTASGIEAGSTPLRFRAVEVGVVEELELTPELTAVEARIRVDNSVARYIDEGAAFWLVEPRVTARGVTGLDTVLSGVQIEGTWDSTPGVPQDTFLALEEIPLALPGEVGTRVVLQSREGGQLAAGAPVLFNGIEVGRLGVPVLSDTGTIVTMEAFIEAPHDARLTTTSRFWDISGISVDLGAGGVSINFDSIASLIEGGVAFGTLVTGGEPIEDGHVYDVYGSAEAAREAAFERPIEQALTLSVLLPSEDLRLTEGAVVRYNGLRVGEVTNITGYVDPRNEDAGVQMLVTFTAAPDRLGLADASQPEDVMADLGRRVEAGLRVRVGAEGLLGGTHIVELFEDEEAEPGSAEMNFDLIDTPLLPGAPPQVGEGAENLDAVVTRVANLPIEELMDSAIDALDSVTALAGSEDMRSLPQNANDLIGEARALVTSEDISAALTDLSDAAAALDELVARVSGSEGVATTLTALEQTDDIVADLEAFTSELPGLLDSVDTLIADLGEVPVADVVASADAVIARIDSLLASEGVQNIPVQIDTALSDLSAILGQLREGGAAESVLATLSEAEVAVAEVNARLAELEGTAEIVGNVRLFSEDLPNLSAQAEALLTSIQEAQIDQVVTSANTVLARIDKILSAEGAERLPDTLDTALGELSAVLTDLREAGTTDSLVATLNSADAAFAEVSATLAELEGVGEIVTNLQTATADLPGLVDDAEALIASLNEAPVAEAAESLDLVLRRVEGILATSGAEELPNTLNDTLTEVETVLRELREGGAAENLNATLQSANDALGAVESAADQFPALVTRLDGAVVTLQGLVGNYDQESILYREIRSAIRDFSGAAEAFRSLARTIERNPSAILR